MADLFAEEPRQWGLRGDPFAWRAMRDLLADVPVPADAAQARELIAATFRGVVRVDLDAPSGEPTDGPDPTTYVEGLARGGMSSGQVDLATWREVLVPLLVERAGDPGE